MSLQVLTRTNDPAEAHILRGRLAAEGIPAVLADDQLVSLWWPMATAFGGVRVMVPAACLEDAGEVLRAYHDGDLEALPDDAPPPPAPTCPACASTDLRVRVPLRQKLLAVLLFVVGEATIHTRQSTRYCGACGHAWPRTD